MKLLKNLALLLMAALFSQLTVANMTSLEAKQQNVAAKLQETQMALGITGAEQTAAWDNYKTVLMNRVTTLSEEKMKMRAAREGVDVAQLGMKEPKVKGQPKEAKTYANKAMDRFNQQINFEKLNIKTLEDQKAAFEKLYKTLTPAQQALADQRIKIK